MDKHKRFSHFDGRWNREWITIECNVFLLIKYIVSQIKQCGNLLWKMLMY